MEQQNQQPNQTLSQTTLDSQAQQSSRLETSVTSKVHNQFGITRYSIAMTVIVIILVLGVGTYAFLGQKNQNIYSNPTPTISKAEQVFLDIPKNYEECIKSKKGVKDLSGTCSVSVAIDCSDIQNLQKYMYPLNGQLDYLNPDKCKIVFVPPKTPKNDWREKVSLDLPKNWDVIGRGINDKINGKIVARVDPDTNNCSRSSRDVEAVSTEEKDINGLPFTVVLRRIDDGHQPVYLGADYCITQGDNSFSITFWDYHNSSNQLTPTNAKLFDQIAGSIKFTDYLDTSNWQTYRNEKFGFEFRYPSSLKVYDRSTGIKSVGFIPLCSNPETTIACLVIPPEEYPDTYFEGAVFAVITDYYYVDDPCDLNNKEGADITVNGVKFKKYTIGDGATGHTMGGYLYAVPRNEGKICLGIQLAFDKYRWEPLDAKSGIKEFTQQNVKEVSDRLNQILSTFRFVE